MKHPLALTVLLLAQLVSAYAAEPGQEKTRLDITCKTTEQGPLRLDLHYPDARKEGVHYPLVIFTHGGG